MGCYLNRTLCDVLREMRTCLETLNFSYLSSLIEEAQFMGNRMEAGLENGSEYKNLVIKISKLNKEKDKLENEIELLKDKTERN